MANGWFRRKVVGGIALSVIVACSLSMAVVPTMAFAEDAVDDVVVLGGEPDSAVQLEVEEPDVELVDSGADAGTAQDELEATGDEVGDVEVQSSNDTSAKQGITVNGVTYTGAKSGSGRDGGTWSWDGAGNLVLDGYKGGNIATDGTTLNVELRGTNVISKFHIDPASDYWGYNGLNCINSDGETSIKVSGPGSLKIDAGEVSKDDVGHNFGMRGIAATRVTIEGAEVTIDLSKVTDALLNGSMALSGTEIEITKGSKVVAKGGKEEAKYIRGAIYAKRISILDSTVQATAPEGSIAGSIYFIENLRIENSIVKAPHSSAYAFSIYTSDFSEGVASVINSDVIAPSFKSHGFDLRNVRGATVDSEEHDSYSFKYLKPGSDGTVRLVHTGGASAYDNGVGVGSKSISPAKVTLPATSYTYNGKARKPKPVVKLGGTKLVSGTDYVVSYKANKSVGTVTVTVTGMGTYAGTAKATFKIVPKGTKLTKLAAGKGSFKASWKRQATQTSGYQIQYTRSRSFSGAKVVTVKGSRTSSKKVSGLKHGKAYRVRVRTWKKVGSKTYYSSWSAAKSVKTK